ncbi:uncharacterized protein LACBIDRAFT_305586 [Laccaria bicolor S238N-H82]|nr:uncharacterized protein LACBIDRAFT_305586 [Laccaria bicolor S238N-H82]EDR14693.1 predicted protein [Laccaria bicolor S238N-H82]|eukprot:XP_001875252.1 predicted protein [Laccaria bicolor S238N-H82]
MQELIPLPLAVIILERDVLPAFYIRYAILPIQYALSSRSPVTKYTCSQPQRRDHTRGIATGLLTTISKVKLPSLDLSTSSTRSLPR